MRGSDTITDSYSRMTLSSNDIGQGGLVGNIEAGIMNEKHAIIAHSYFAGSINSTDPTVSGELIGSNFAAWDGPFSGVNGVHLVRNKVNQTAYGTVGSSAAINVVNDSTQAFTLPAQWEGPANFTSWLASIWAFPPGMYPDHLP
jgi:hypothetical protein